MPEPAAASTPSERSSATASAPPASTRSSVGPVEISAKGLHELAIEAFRIGNRGRLSLCEALRVLTETRLHLELGFPTLESYAGTFFHLRRSEAFEHVRVARTLVELTRLRQAFADGRIGWSALKAITRVASVASQERWIEFVRQHGIERTLAEVQDAQRRGRDAPRASSYGLPNLDQKLVLRGPRSDMDKVRSWIAAAAAQIAERTGAGDVSLEQALLFLCEQDMALSRSPADAGGPAGESPPRSVGETPRAQIVYQSCPDCRRARVGTREGFVEVAPEELERYEGSAEAVVIDGPTPPRLRRQILGREGGRCGNPRCQLPASHCHHVKFRSRGGRTELDNEVAVCTTCHALIHAGLLRVSGNANAELSWAPAVDPVSARVAPPDRTRADRLPVVQVATSDDGRESAIADSATALDPEQLAGGLTRLGVSVRESRKIIQEAMAALPLAEQSEASILRRALGRIQVAL